MNHDLRTEYYLAQLDRELAALPISERARIVTEMKTRIVEALAVDPTRSFDAVMDEIGTSRAVAERYLAAKGLKLQPQRRTGRMFKWLAIGTVAFFGLIFAAALFAIWYLSPIVRIDEKRGHVSLFGGLIEVNEELGKVKIGDLTFSDNGIREDVVVRGEQNLDGLGIKLVRIPFNTARIVVNYSTDALLRWECRAAKETGLVPETEAGVLTLNLDRLNLARCTLLLPKGAETQFRGVNGHMDVAKPLDDLDISLNNGKVNIHPDPEKAYDFDVHVKNGLKDFFPRSRDRQAVKVKVNVVNGTVKKE